MRKIAIATIATVAVSLFASSAFAQGAIVQQSAMGSAIACVPLSSPTLPVPWVQTHGKVEHSATSTADIVLFCPVQISTLTIPLPNPGGAIEPLTVFTVKYVDPDATGAEANVLAELKYADAAGNMVEVAVATSSAQSGGGTGITTMNASIGKLDLSQGQLFVQLTLHRTTTRLFPAVYGWTLH
ncbi:MAG TPA: hypothetical protein VGL86_22995 [Polyangia bacterium]